MEEEGLFYISDASAITALGQFAAKEAIRGKGMLDTARKVFRFLVSFALKKIPDGDPRKIRSQLMTVITTYSRLRAASIGVSSSLRTRKTNRSRTADALRSTLAAKLVYILNYLGARHVHGAEFTNS